MGPSYVVTPAVFLHCIFLGSIPRGCSAEEPDSNLGLLHLQSGAQYFFIPKQKKCAKGDNPY
jgi:hypothetical protein